MGFVYHRDTAKGRVYWISFNHEGERFRERAGTDKREAERFLARREREVREGITESRPNGRAPTLRRFAEGFFESRAARSVRSVADEQARFRLHVDPKLGRLRVDEITPKIVAAWVEEMKLEGQLSAKSIRNTHGVLSVILGQAQFEELVEVNAAKGLPRGILPPLKSKKPVPYSRDELAVMLGHPAVPPDVRVLLALMGLAGLRLGEACGRRWRDLNTNREPLWRLRVHDQYDGQPLKTAEHGDAKERDVPVHPVLRDLLIDWYREGFEATLGRPPRPADPITPWPARMAPRSENQAGKAADKAIAAAGIERIRGRRVHSLRRSFISLARSDGARRDVLETVTHNARGEIIDVYTEFVWPARCEAVSALRITPLEAMPEKDATQATDLDRDDAGLDPLAGLKAP